MGARVDSFLVSAPFAFFVQLRNKLNQDQNSKLQQHRENLNKRNLEVASMDKRISELRDRLWKKKAALQQKENLPVSLNKLRALPVITINSLPRNVFCRSLI